MLPSCRAYSVMARRAPLNILFCGSDAFSIASLKALNEAKASVPGLIDSIDVVHRPAKRTGRGLRVLMEGMLILHLFSAVANKQTNNLTAM